MKNAISTTDGSIVLTSHEEHTKQCIIDELWCYNCAMTKQRLFSLEFTSIEEYLTLLEFAAKELNRFGSNVCFYLAAAVSDFYIPDDLMAQHKIQSSEGLHLDLQQVPKLLGKLTTEWAPMAYCVSFKLETDSNQLVSKATGAIQKYKVHLVVANLLQTRFDECKIIYAVNNIDNEKSTSESGLFQVDAIQKPPHLIHLEPLIVECVANHHKEYIQINGGIAPIHDELGTNFKERLKGKYFK